MSSFPQILLRLPRLASLLIMMALWTASGCGSSIIRHQVKMDYLKEVSRQGQLWIYDAENEIVVALDRLDDGKDRLREIRNRIEQGEQSLELAERRNNQQGVEVVEAWLEYLKGMEVWIEDNIQVLRRGVLLAKANVELAKAQVINREDLLAGKDFSIKKYQEQYDEIKSVFDKEREENDKKLGEANKMEKRWWKIRQRYIAQSGDFDSGLWTP